MAGFNAWGAMPLDATPVPPVGGTQLGRQQRYPIPKPRKDFSKLPPDIEAALAGVDAGALKAAAAREASNEDLKARLEAAMQRDLPTDLTPIAALVDQWSGSNFSSSYKPSETAGMRRDEISGLRDAISKGAIDAEAANLAALKGKLDTRFAMDNQAFERGQKDIDNQFRGQQIDLQSRQLDIQRQAAAAKATGKLTPGQEALDKAYGKEYSDYVAGGGHAAAEKNLAQLSSAAARLQASSDATGTAYGFTPDWLKPALNEDGTTIQQDVNGVVMGSLRQLLGSAFTENEGKRVLNSTYDPKLSPQANAKRLVRLQEQLAVAFEQKRRSAEYFEQYGTLVGFKGHLPTVEDFIGQNQKDGTNGQTSNGFQFEDTSKMTIEQKREYLKRAKAAAGE